MTDTPTTLVCPKCQGAMRTYERNSVVIDQCTDCRGVYLDRGELERLIDAEEQRYAPAPATFPPPSNPDSGRDEDDRRYGPRDDTRHGGGHHGESKSGKRRRGGFLGELFD